VTLRHLDQFARDFFQRRALGERDGLDVEVEQLVVDLIRDELDQVVMG
jgi:hypothetical protein